MTTEILELVHDLDAGSFGPDAASALMDYAGTTATDPLLDVTLEAAPPYMQRALLIELRAFKRMQEGEYEEGGDADG